MTPQDVRDWLDGFERRRETVRRLRERLQRLSDPIHAHRIGLGVSSGDHADTTAETAMATMRAKESLEAEEVALDTDTERAVRVLTGAGKVLGIDTSCALIDHYITGMTWGAVASYMDVSAPTLYRMRDAACDWIATVGYERAAEGMGIAEEE